MDEIRGYYRILLSSEQLLRVVRMDWNEYEYYENKILRDERGEWMRFGTELEAINYLNENFRPERIDPEFLSPNNPNFRR